MPDYTLVQTAVTFLDAVQQCPQRVPGSQLARVTSDSDYSTISSLLVASFPNPTDIYQGAWIGLNAINSPDQTTPSTPGVPATGWRLVEGTNLDGPLATNEQLRYWGGLGTGFAGLPQPDNSGGSQRCVLIAVGAIPPTQTSPFYEYAAATQARPRAYLAVPYHAPR